MELFKRKSSEYFEYYYDFIEKKTARSVNELFNAATSVNDLLMSDTRGGIKKDLFSSNDYLLVKMLRNFNAHAGCVISDFKMTDELATKELKPDLGFCCLISSVVYESAKRGRGVKLADIEKIDSAASIVGCYVDIHPAIFNLSVYIYECLTNLGLSLDTKEYSMMKESYDKETLHEIGHYVIPSEFLDVIFDDGSSIEKHIIPFQVSDKVNSGLPEYNLLAGLDDPLDINTIDFYDLARNFKQYIKCINGKSVSYYEKDLIRFEELKSKEVFSSLKYILSYDRDEFKKVIVDVGALIESSKGEEIRYKLLNFNVSAIFVFGKKKYITGYDYTYDLILYLSMLINIQIHGLEHKETKVMFKIISSNGSVEAANALSNIRKNKSSMYKFSHMIFSQVVMLLIEFPFKDHQRE